MNKSYKNYFTKVTEISEYFSEEQAEKIIKAAEERLYTELGNKLIHLMKEYKEISAETILFSLFQLMSKLEEQEEARANSNDYINSLSSNAKKEWARKMSYGSSEIEL